MKIYIKYDVLDCTNCPFAYSHIGHGECWTECSHKQNGRKPYENILWGCQEQFKAVPLWCPLGLAPKHCEVVNE